MSKVEFYTPKKIQITCPSCHYEFPYNRDALNKRIDGLGQAIHKLNKNIIHIEKMPEEQINTKELKRLKKQLLDMQQIIADYKLIRETLKQNEDTTNQFNLKMIIKEFYGAEEYKRCIDEMLRRSTAYDVSRTTNNRYGL